MTGNCEPYPLTRKTRLERLTRRAQFAAVLTYDNAAAGARFIVRAKPNGLTHARLGIIAGRKAIPRAVDRNRSKRLVREVFRATQRMLAALDVVVLCRSRLARGQNAAGRAEITRLFTAVRGCRGTRSAASTL